MSHLYTTRNPMSEARRQHFYGILQPLEDYRAMEGTRALNHQLVGFPLVMMLVAAVVFVAAVMWPDEANAASGTGLSPCGSSLQAVSPVPASIPFAGDKR